MNFYPHNQASSVYHNLVYMPHVRGSLSSIGLHATKTYAETYEIHPIGSPGSPVPSQHMAFAGASGLYDVDQWCNILRFHDISNRV